jgi:hypothetical protein
MNPDCFGLEFYDEDKTVCPHMDCLLRADCKDTYEVSRGLRDLRKEKEKIFNRNVAKYSRGVSKLKKEFFEEEKKEKKAQKRGYRKPAKLDYVDKGYPRDQFVSTLRQAALDLGYETKATKCLHTFYNTNGDYLAKVDTRRQKSVLVYISDEVAEILHQNDMLCRYLYENERLSMPEFIMWVVKISNLIELDKVLSALKSVYGTTI